MGRQEENESSPAGQRTYHEVGADELGRQQTTGDAGAVVAAIGEAWKMKPDGSVWKGRTEETAARVSMRAIAG